MGSELSKKNVKSKMFACVCEITLEFTQVNTHAQALKTETV